MSEERSASFPPSADSTVATKPVNGSDSSIDVSIDTDEPEEAARKPPPPKAADGASSSVDRSALRADSASGVDRSALRADSPSRVGETTVKAGELRIGETTAKRARSKVTLKIPDDEISRPQISPPSAHAKASEPPAPPPALPEVVAPPMTPMRIITIEPPPVAPKAATVPPPQPAPASIPRPTASADDSWTPYQPTVADRAASAPPPPAAPPAPVPRPPRPSYHSSPSHPPSPPQMPAAIPVAPPTIPMPTPPPTEPRAEAARAAESVDDIPIVTDEPPPSSGEIEIDDDARPTRPAVLRVPEPKLVPAGVQIAHVGGPPASVERPPLRTDGPSVVLEAPTVHTAVTPVAAPVAAPASSSASASASASATAAAPAGPIAPSPPRVVSVPPAAASQPQVSIKDLPPMRALAPTEPEGLEVHFEDEEAVSTPRPSEPEAEIAAEDLVSVESAPSASSKQAGPKSAVQTETPARGFVPPGGVVTAAGSAAGPVARASVPPPPSIAKPPAGAQKITAPRVIVPSASPLSPPPMSDTAPTGRRKARPWWEELFNDDFIRTMAKISDTQIAKEVDFIEESLAVAKGAMLLDLGCGTGRHAIELTRRGYKVVGFDLSLPMLAKAAEEAQDRTQKLNFVQGDMREMTFEDTFDGIYCWNTSFGFFEEDKNNQVIQRVHKALKKGGQFVLEVGNRDFIIRQAPSLAWFEGDGCICMDEMSIDWITSRMKVKRTMMMDDGRTKEIDYSVRIYSLHELGKILHDAGFRVAEVSGRTGTPGVYFGSESPRTMILAEKK